MLSEFKLLGVCFSPWMKSLKSCFLSTTYFTEREEQINKWKLVESSDTWLEVRSFHWQYYITMVLIRERKRESSCCDIDFTFYSLWTCSKLFPVFMHTKGQEAKYSVCVCMFAQLVKDWESSKLIAMTQTRKKQKKIK